MIGSFTSDTPITCLNPAVLGACNLLVRATGTCFFNENVVGPLSINTAVSGAITWQRERRRLRVDGNSFLVLPNNGPFSLEIAERKPVSLACVYFKNGFVESIEADMRASDLEPHKAVSLEFLAHLHPRDERIARRIALLSGPDADGDLLFAGEQFLLLARDLVLLGRKAHASIHSLPAQKPSTREELFRRVARGRDFLHSHGLSRVKLEDAAVEACVSPFHFHRTFTHLFGMSPHEYVTRIRMDLAVERLKHDPEAIVTEIAAEAGFASATSFTKAFKRRFGLSPKGFRDQHVIRPRGRSLTPGRQRA